MIVVDVLDLVGENVGKLIFGHHQLQHAFADVDRSAGKRKGVDHVVIWENGEGVRQMSMGVNCNRASDTGDIFLESFFFRSKLACLRCVASGKFLADGDFSLVGDAREVHGDAGETALGIGGHIQDGVGRYGIGLGAALVPIEPGEREAQDEKKKRRRQRSAS